MPLTNFTVSGITARLFNLIQQMNPDEQKNLLILLGDLRKTQRIPYLMPVSYKTNSQNFTNFILDIGPGGTFIETEESFFIGQKLTMTFNFKFSQEPFVISGIVVWKNTHGIGVQFSFHDKEHKKELKTLLNYL